MDSKTPVQSSTRGAWPSSQMPSSATATTSSSAAECSGMRQHLAHARRYAVSPAFRFRRRLLPPLRDLPKLRRIHPLRRKRSTESKQRRVLLRSGRQVARGDHGTVRHRAPLDGGSSGHGFIGAALIGSGIMAAKLAGGNTAIALLCNTLATGAILVVIITIFAPISGAHFNPAVKPGDGDPR